MRRTTWSGLSALAAALTVTISAGTPAWAAPWAVSLQPANSAQTHARGAPGAPTGVTATQTGSNQAAVSWTPVSSAATYAVSQSSTAASGPYSTVATVTTTSWTSGTLASGRYWFEVTATAGANWTGSPSAPSPVAIASGGYFAAIGPPSTVSNSTNNVVVGYPTGTAQNDLVLLVVVNSASQNASVGSSGWTLIAGPNLGGSGMELQAWWHVAGTESSVTLSQLQANASGASAWVIDYKNVPSPATAGASSGTASSASAVAPSAVTTTSANALVISLVAINVAHQLTLSTSQGFTARAATTVNSPSPGSGLAVADQFVPTAGSVPAPTWAEATSASQWAYITVAFT